MADAYRLPDGTYEHKPGHKVYHAAVAVDRTVAFCTVCQWRSDRDRDEQPKGAA